MAKKTIEQLDAQIKATEARLRKQKQERAKATEAERKREAAELLRAVDEWRGTLPNKLTRSECIATFRKWSDKNREKYGTGSN